MNDEQQRGALATSRSRGLVILFAILIIWALVVAIGSYWSKTSDTDIRRPLIVIATMALFLGAWAVALVAKRRRMNRD